MGHDQHRIATMRLGADVCNQLPHFDCIPQLHWAPQDLNRRWLTYLMMRLPGRNTLADAMCALSGNLDCGASGDMPPVPHTAAGATHRPTNRQESLPATFTCVKEGNGILEQDISHDARCWLQVHDLIIGVAGSVVHSP